MTKPHHLIFLIFLLPTLAWGQYQQIDNFIVKENLTANGKIAIIAVDSLENADENINGTFKFSINGFEQSLDFNNGVAVPAHAIESSTFVYFKHKNPENTASRFYFLYKKDSKITPIKVNGLVLLVIPALLLLIAYALKRFMVTFALLALAYGYFAYSKGLSPMQLLESAYHTIIGFF